MVLNRFGRPDAATVSRLTAFFDTIYPGSGPALNAELASIVVYLEAPYAAAKTVALLEQAPTQEEQLEYGRSLRVLKTGWTPELRKAYFNWIRKAYNYRGGNSFRGFVKIIRNDAIASLSESEKTAARVPARRAPVKTAVVAAAPPRPFVKAWTLDELNPIVDKGLKGRNFDRGRLLFGAAQCASCHRYNNEGGSFGPDLTGASGRFSASRPPRIDRAAE